MYRRGFHGVGIAATTAAVCQTTRHESAGCGMRVLRRYSRGGTATGRLEADQLNTVCVCMLARRPNSTYLAAESAPVCPSSCLTASLAAAPAADSLVHKGVT